MKENGWFIGIWAAIGTVATWLLGAFDPVLQLLVYLMIFDFFTGVLNAIIIRGYSTKKALMGVLTKFTYLLIVGLGARLDAAGLYAEPIARTALAWGIIIIELGSVIENLNDLGVPVPAFLLKIKNFIKTNEENNGR